jgi:hypothetical protein
MEQFDTQIYRIRQALKELAEVPESGLQPSADPEMWQLLDEIEAVGRTHDASKANWLAGFTQFDEFDILGRRYILATAALAALAEMPEAAFEAGRDLWLKLPADASRHRKIGLCKVLEASGSAKAIPLIESLTQDSSAMVREEAARALQHLRGDESQSPDNLSV